MKICVFGAGAIGSHLALRLAQGGTEVSAVARGAQLAAIARNGIIGRRPDGQETRAQVRASDDPAALGPQDAVIVTVKAPALPSVARAIGPLLRPDTPVAFVMNGIPWWYFYAHGGPLDGRRLAKIDPGDAMWNAIGPARAVGGIVNAPSTVVAPGVVLIERDFNYVVLGEPDGSVSPRVEAIAKALRDGGLEASATPDIRTAVWNKLIGNLASGPPSILAQATYRQVFSEPACVEGVLRVMQEATAIAVALGCRPDTDHEKRLALVRNIDHKPSILQDLELGRPMEIDSIQDAALELARMVGVATPTLDLLVALVKIRARNAGLYGAD